MFLLTLRYNQDGTKAVLDEHGKFQRTLERGESIAVSRKDHCTLVPSDPVRVALILMLVIGNDTCLQPGSPVQSRPHVN